MSRHLSDFITLHATVARGHAPSRRAGPCRVLGCACGAQQPCAWFLDGPVRALLTVAGDELKKDGGNEANRVLRADRTEQPKGWAPNLEIRCAVSWFKPKAAPPRSVNVSPNLGGVPPWRRPPPKAEYFWAVSPIEPSKRSSFLLNYLCSAIETGDKDRLYLDLKVVIQSDGAETADSLPRDQIRRLRLRLNKWFLWAFPAFGWDIPSPGR